MLFTQSQRSNDSLCIIIVRGAKSLHTVDSSIMHGRTAKKSHGSGTQISYLAQEDGNNLFTGNESRINFYKSEITSVSMVWKKKKKK